jgi:hypothetical protein
MRRMTSLIKRLSLFTGSRTAYWLKVIGGDPVGLAGPWEPISQAQGASLGLAPWPQARGEWTVAGQAQAPRRQPTLADLAVLYQHFIAKERKRPHASFEVKA